jgi:hypothetical protein
VLVMLTPEQLAELTARYGEEIATLAQQQFDRMLELIAQGSTPRDAIRESQREFGALYTEQLAAAFGDLLSRSVGVAEVRTLPVGDITLSMRLYRHQQQVEGEVIRLVRDHAKGVLQARDLAMRLYDGYDPKDGIVRPLEGSARGELPVYLRKLTEDRPAREALAQLIEHGQAQIARIRSAPLRTAYTRALAAWEDDEAGGALTRRLELAVREKNRYFAQRIAQSELARAHQAQVAREYMADDQLEVVRVTMSRTHPVPDVCDYHARGDFFGLGRGIYPKAKAPRPPFHPHCLPGTALVSTGGRIAAVVRRRYDGDMVVITTASGKRLEATVNHPVLTSSGWLAAGLVHVGGDVIGRLGRERPELGDDDHQDVPATIAEVFDAFGRSREVATVEVPTSTPDFHGDGMAGEVAVIRADRKLRDRMDPAFLQSLGDVSLIVGVEPLGLLPGGLQGQALERALGAPGSIVRSGGEGLPLVSGQQTHADGVLLAGGPSGDAGLGQAQVDSLPGDVELAREIQNGSTGEVFADDVVSVERYAFSGHVYNLETTTRHYTSNGIVTHNCRCTLDNLPSRSAAGARPVPMAGAAFLRALPGDEASRIVGSRERLQAALMGADPVGLMDAGKAPQYRTIRMGDAAAGRHHMLED